MSKIGKMPHFDFTGSIRLDMYVNKIHIKTFIPAYDIEKQKVRRQ